VITGIWVSPNRTEIIVQWDEENLTRHDFTQTLPACPSAPDSRDVDMVPADWDTAFEGEQ
jgi:hypothetical protein